MLFSVPLSPFGTRLSDGTLQHHRPCRSQLPPATTTLPSQLLPVGPLRGSFMERGCLLYFGIASAVATPLIRAEASQTLSRAVPDDPELGYHCLRHFNPTSSTDRMFLKAAVDSYRGSASLPASSILLVFSNIEFCTNAPLMLTRIE
jgi:hypothetical protein